MGVSGDPSSGADGNLWFTEFKPNNLIFEGVYIGSITTSGTITEYLVPSSNDYMNGIASGPDGNIWFVESAGKIGHLVMNAPDITEAPSLTMAPNNTFRWPRSPILSPRRRASIVPR